MHKEEKNSRPKLTIISLNKQTSFDLANKRGEKYYSRFFILIGMRRSTYAVPATTETQQKISLEQSQESGIVYLGLKISKKIGQAVTRNKTRRRLKSLLRSNLKVIATQKWCHWTFVIIPRKGFDTAKYSELADEILQTLCKCLGVQRNNTTNCSL